MKRHPFLILSFALVLLVSGGRAVSAADLASPRTSLDDYVEKEDKTFEWKIVKSGEKSKADDVQTFVLDMKSQTWRTKADVDRTVWQHWITVAVPKEIKSDIGFMFIGGGGNDRNGGKPPEGPSDMVQQIAKATQTVVAEIHMIPNQPLVFHNDGERRSEDDLIAYTWVKFLETGDDTWPARLPMVKSVVRGMDAVTALLASKDGGQRTVDKYFVAGGSKRGWTTWLTAAVDQRVVGIAPIVIDILNLKDSMKHHFSVYGFYAPSIGDYVEHKLVQMGNHPRMAALHAIEDPYTYRQRFTMPKFVMNAAGDEFFPPDHSRYYYDDLIGEKHLRYVPNSRHSLDGTDAIESLIAFYSLVLAGKPGPNVTWTRPEENTFHVQTADKPKEVRLWQATNPEARDFRMETLGPKYTSQVLEPESDGSYVGKVSQPEAGYTAFFVELTYDVGAPTPLKVTTNVGIVPDVFPFAKKDPTLPTSLTLRCNVKDKDALAKVQAALKSPAMQKIGEDARVLIVDEAATENIPVAINWVPKGKYEDSARTLGGSLEKLGCDDFVYQMESGRLEGAK